MMALNEAIAHAEEKAKENRKKADEWKTCTISISRDAVSTAKNNAEKCEQCAEEHEQLAEWLKELKELKEAYESDYQVDDLIQVCVKLWG